MFKKTLLAGAVAAALLPGVGSAADSPHTLTGNVGLFSQYIFRGLTQTNGDPALQGGFDWSHSSGWYAGTWASNISWLKENATQPAGVVVGTTAPTVIGTYGQGGSLEWDFYAGWKWGFAPDWTLDLGTLYYWYPGKISATYNTLVSPLIPAPKADTWEIYAGLSWKWLSAKLSYAIKDEVFGTLDADGTYYLDLTASYPIPNTKLTLIAHYGIQKYTGTDLRNFVVNGVRMDNDSLYSYDDWKLGISYALPKDFTIGVFYTDTSGDNVLGYGSVNDVGAGGNRGPYPKRISKGTGTVFIQKTF